MKTFSKPFHELGGVFVDYKANRARSLTIRNNFGIQVISAADGSKKPIQVPPGARVSNASWAPDGASIAYLVHTDDATTLLDLWGRWAAWMDKHVKNPVNAADAKKITTDSPSR